MLYLVTFIYSVQFTALQSIPVNAGMKLCGQIQLQLSFSSTNKKRINLSDLFYIQLKV